MFMDAVTLLEILSSLSELSRIGKAIYKWTNDKIEHRITVYMLMESKGVKRVEVMHADDRKEFLEWKKGAYCLDKFCIDKAYKENKMIGREIFFAENNPIPLNCSDDDKIRIEQKLEEIVKRYNESAR